MCVTVSDGGDSVNVPSDTVAEARGMSAESHSVDDPGDARAGARGMSAESHSVNVPSDV